MTNFLEIQTAHHYQSSKITCKFVLRPIESTPIPEDCHAGNISTGSRCSLKFENHKYKSFITRTKHNLNSGPLVKPHFEGLLLCAKLRFILISNKLYDLLDPGMVTIQAREREKQEQDSHKTFFLRL